MDVAETDANGWIVMPPFVEIRKGTFKVISRSMGIP